MKYMMTLRMAPGASLKSIALPASRTVSMQGICGLLLSRWCAEVFAAPSLLRPLPQQRPFSFWLYHRMEVVL
jgi:hypothetical protein